MGKSKKLFLIGDSAFAEIAYEYFSYDSDYEVVGFAVERAYLKKSELFGRPIVPFEDIERYFTPGDVDFYAALVYTEMNRLRTRLYLAARAKGYTPASYISSRSFIWRNVTLGEHAFVFEDNTIQPFVSIGNNVVLWSGNHIGHHSVVQDNCFIASHVVISGFCNIGANSFLGVNATVANNVAIGEDTWVGLGAGILKNTQPNLLFKGKQSETASVSAKQFFKLAEQ